ncbi:hypothetical protein HK098_003846 [Nowakowskiella sp. JEL0407]|nr:hypothetical protein HK098_003846 [Nowakowskiella sp. JEL0407]
MAKDPFSTFKSFTDEESDHEDEIEDTIPRTASAKEVTTTPKPLDTDTVSAKIESKLATSAREEALKAEDTENMLKTQAKRSKTSRLSVMFPKINPAIMTEEIEAKDTISSAFSAISSLAIIIKISASLGDDESIDIAVDKINKAVKNVENVLEKAEGLKATGVATYGKQLLEIVGPKGAEFHDRRESLLNELTAEMMRREDSENKVIKARTELERVTLLWKATT